jgi:hypothetical protein
MGNRYKDFDELVERYGFDKEICPNVSKHWGNQLPSDQLFDMWTMYFMRNIASKHFELSYGDTRYWGPVECMEFYSKRLQTASGEVHELYRMSSDDDAMRSAMGLTAHESGEVLAYRWNHGYVFTDYKERIQIAMGKKAVADGKECFDAIAKIENLLKEKDALVAGIEELSSDPKIDARLRAMLKNMDVSFTDVELED